MASSQALFDESSDEDSVVAPAAANEKNETQNELQDANNANSNSNSNGNHVDNSNGDETPATATTAATATAQPSSKADSKDNNDQPEDASSEHPKPPLPPSSADLFGDDDDDSDDDSDEGGVEFDDAGAGIVGTSAPDQGSRNQSASNNNNNNNNNNNDMDSSEEGASMSKSSSRRKKEPRFMHVLDATLPKKGVTMHTTKLPNLLLGINPEAFDEETFSAATEQQEYSDVHNMIRWRYKRAPSQNNGGPPPLERDRDGSLVRESNARMVQWEDGSFTLHVGKEAFEVDALNTKTPTGFAGINGYLYLSQKATYKNNEEDDEQETPGGTVLECMGQIESKLTVRPSSLHSDAHKSLTVSVRQRHMKQSRIAEYVTQVDPEQAKLERIKVNEDLDKAAQRKNKSYASQRAGGGGTGGRRPGMNRRYMEQEDSGNYDDVGDISAMKRARFDDNMDYGEDSEDEDEDDWEQQKRTRQPKKAKGGPKDDVDDDIVLDEDSSDQEEITRVKAPAKKRTNLAVFDDDDDDDDDDDE